MNTKVNLNTLIKKITKDILLVLSAINSMKSKKSYGGTAPEKVKKSIQYAIKKYL